MNDQDKQRMIDEIKVHLVAIGDNQQDTLRRAILAGVLLTKLAKVYKTKRIMCDDVGIGHKAAYNYMRLAKKGELVPADINGVTAAIASLKGKQGRAKVASSLQQVQVVELSKAGQSIRKIVEIMGLTKSVVHTIVRGDYNKAAPTGKGKLTSDDAEIIRDELRAGAKNKDVAQRWKVSCATITHIKNDVIHRPAAAATPDNWASVRSKLMSIWNSDPAEYDRIVEQIEMRHKVLRAEQAGFMPARKAS